MSLKRFWVYSLFLVTLLHSAASAHCSMRNDTVAGSFMARVGDAVVKRASDVESLSASLYIKERVNVTKKNLLLNLLPNMTRFDKGEKVYLAELFYDVQHVYDMMPEIRRVSSVSTFRHSSGEMDLVMSFMTPQIHGKLLFGDEYLSPLYPENQKYYNFQLSASGTVGDTVIVDFEARYDNVMLIECGRLCIDRRNMLPVSVLFEGRNEEGRFEVCYIMGGEGLERSLVRDIELRFDYDFVYNRLAIDVYAGFDYTALVPRNLDGGYERKYNLTQAELPRTGIEERFSYATKHRQKALTRADSLLYAEKDVLPLSVPEGGEEEALPALRGIRNMMWLVADGAISSHSLAWGNSDIKFSPVINPSYLSYSSSRGLAYKLSFNFRNRLTRNVHFRLNPFVGYNFKRSEMYWGIRGDLQFAPLRRAAFTFDVGRDASIFSSVELDRISDSPLDSIDFETMPFVRYRDMHMKGNFKFEIANGLELRLGTAFYRRSMSGSAVNNIVNGVKLGKYHKQFAPNVGLSWHPGMYYYISDGRKINLGSRAPRFAVDVEQGIKGLFDSDGRYTRIEFDVQYRRTMPSSASLYMRGGIGGYMNADDLYFVNYSFLKNNYLPLDKEDELSGAFHLLDGEWYNSANKYIRANLSYESHFLFLQRLVPSARFVRSETLYGGVLFISHLSPYTEYGYGVETPYINIGVFLSFENLNFHRLGYKMSISLFDD